MGTGPVDDATPKLDELQQHEISPVVVPVKHDGPVYTHELPARTGPMFAQTLSTSWQHILGEDLKRKRATLVCDAEWEVSRTRGSGVRWPADVPLPLSHCDSVYARVPADEGNLSVITEVYAD